MRKKKIQRLYQDGFAVEEIALMFPEERYESILRALKGFKRTTQ